MLHGLVCFLVVVALSTGCAGSMTYQTERPSGGVGQSASVVGMSALIRTTKGTGLVLGLTVPFDIGAHTSADESSLKVSNSTRMMSVISGKSPAQIEAKKQASQQGGGPRLLVSLRPSM